MKRTLIAIAMALALVLIPVGSAFAATDAEVTVEATPGWVSISIALTDPTDYDFLVVLANTTPNTGNGYFIITNDSTVLMDLSIECVTWSPVSGTNSWTYGDPALADNQARLNASSAEGNGASGGAGSYDIPVLVGSASLLCNAAPTTTNPTFELELETPRAFTFVDEQQTTVTLTASVDV